MIFVCIPSLLFAVASLDFACRPVHSSLHWIGASTYAVYLIHMPVIFIFMLFGLHRWAESPWLLTVFFGLTISLAVLIYRNFELPAQRAIRARLHPISPAYCAT